MLFLVLFLLVSSGGSFGGCASAIAQKQQGKKFNLGFLLESMLIGAATSVSMFFLVESLFGLSPDSPRNTAPSKEATKVELSNTASNTINIILVHLDRESRVYSKIFSLSVAAGFAGIPLMNSLSQQLLSRVDGEEEEDSLSFHLVNDQFDWIDNQNTKVILVSNDTKSPEKIDLGKLNDLIKNETESRQEYIEL